MNDFYTPSDFIRMNSKFIIQKLKEVSSLKMLIPDTHMVINNLSTLCLTQGDKPKDPKHRITHLVFKNSFNERVDNLPPTLTHLTFGFRFNQSVKKLPKGFTHLTFGFRFNQSVDNLPDTITHLTFGVTLTKVQTTYQKLLLILLLMRCLLNL